MNEEIKKIFSALSSEKHYVPGTISILTADRDTLNVTAGQNANWTYANFFILPEKSSIKDFSINEGQFVVLCDNGLWSVYNYEGKPVAQGFEEIKSFVENVSRAEKLRLNYLGGSSNNQRQYSDAPRQIIWYGAPGTGKSFTVNKETNKSNSVRTTFHPDTDYASFVGTYKPSMEKTEVRVIPLAHGVGQSFDMNQGTYEENRIVYKFTPQVFLKAYVAAWKNYIEYPEAPEPYYLVIEEINRGNCAQIFGDLFQLLDREEDGTSTYEIVPDSDIEKFLRDDERGFADVAEIEEFSADIKNGKILKLPSNLYIYATMNTSDQSLFPIDSAFKRRWEWRYTPIAKPAAKNWTISANGKTWSWWKFLERINFEIGKATDSEDKKLGYFFARAKKTSQDDIDNNNGVIEASTFVSKVLFYLWNDVIKDNDFNGDLLRDKNGKPLDFTRFFKIEDGKTVPDEELVEQFIENVMKVELPGEEKKVEVTPEQPADETLEDEDNN